MGIFHGFPEREGGRGSVIVKAGTGSGLTEKPVQANLPGISAQYEELMHGCAPLRLDSYCHYMTEGNNWYHKDEFVIFS